VGGEGVRRRVIGGNPLIQHADADLGAVIVAPMVGGHPGHHGALQASGALAGIHPDHMGRTAGRTLIPAIEQLLNVFLLHLGVDSGVFRRIVVLLLVIRLVVALLLIVALGVHRHLGRKESLTIGVDIFLVRHTHTEDGSVHRLAILLALAALLSGSVVSGGRVIAGAGRLAVLAGGRALIVHGGALRLIAGVKLPVVYIIIIGSSGGAVGIGHSALRAVAQQAKAGVPGAPQSRVQVHRLIVAGIRAGILLKNGQVIHGVGLGQPLVLIHIPQELLHLRALVQNALAPGFQLVAGVQPGAVRVGGAAVANLVDALHESRLVLFAKAAEQLTNLFVRHVGHVHARHAVLTRAGGGGGIDAICSGAGPGQPHRARNLRRRGLRGVQHRPAQRLNLQILAIIGVLIGGSPHELALDPHLSLSQSPLAVALALAHLGNGLGRIGVQIVCLAQIQINREERRVLLHALQHTQIQDVRHRGGHFHRFLPLGQLQNVLAQR